MYIYYIRLHVEYMLFKNVFCGYHFKILFESCLDIEITSLDKCFPKELIIMFFFKQSEFTESTLNIKVQDFRGEFE